MQYHEKGHLEKLLLKAGLKLFFFLPSPEPHLRVRLFVGIFLWCLSEG